MFPSNGESPWRPSSPWSAVSSLLTLAVLMLPNGCSNREPPRPSAGESATEPFDWNREMSGVADGSLKKLAAASYAATPDEFRLLARGCDSLEGLEFDNSKIDAATLAEVLASLPGLKILKLTGPVGDDELRAIAALPHLEILNLPQGRFGDEAFSALSRLASLQLLRFHSPRVSDAGMAVVPELPSLRFLHLIDVPITDGGLDDLTRCPHLESFYLDGGLCTDEGLSAFIRKMPKLHFHWNQLHLPDDPKSHRHN